jgi:hypothetical protein
MRKLWKSMLVGCFATATVIAADTPSKEPALPAGVTAKTLNEFGNIRQVLASATDSALSKSGFDNFVARLTTPDRQRIGDFADREFADLDGRVDQIRKNWKLKYGNDFSMTDAMLDGFVVIKEGEIANPDVVQKNWPLHAKEAGRTNAVMAPNSADTIKYLEKGRNVAVAYIPVSHDLQSVTLSLIQEPGIYDWRIDIPDNLSGQQIMENLKASLTSFGDNVAAWPSDARDAYRMVAHRVILSTYGLPSSAMDQPARPAAGDMPENRPVPQQRP